MHLTMSEALVLVSALMALPAMIVLLAAAFSGALTRSEKARSLPLRSREPDYWEEPGRRQRVRKLREKAAMSPPASRGRDGDD